MTGTIRNKPTRRTLEKGHRLQTRAFRTRIRASNYSVSANKRSANRKGRREIVDGQMEDTELHIDHWDPERQLLELDEYFEWIEKTYGPFSEW
jgi:hypothetical protein